MFVSAIAYEFTKGLQQFFVVGYETCEFLDQAATAATESSHALMYFSGHNAFLVDYVWPWMFCIEFAGEGLLNDEISSFVVLP